MRKRTLLFVSAFAGTLNAQTFLDQTWSSNGVANDTTETATYHFLDVMRTANGVFACGWRENGPTSRKSVVAAFQDNGSMKPMWGVGGTTAEMEATFLCLADQSDGRVLAGGMIYLDDTLRWLIAAFRYDGSLDPSFGDQGLFIWTASIGGYLQDLAVDSQDRIVAVGWQLDAALGTTVVRCAADGTLDTDFGNGGVIFADAPGLQLEQGKGCALGPDGKIGVIAVGTTNDARIHVYAFELDDEGALNEAFADGTGYHVINERGSAGDIHYTPDGSLILSGVRAGDLWCEKLTPEGIHVFNYGYNGQFPGLPNGGYDYYVTGRSILMSDGSLVMTAILHDYLVDEHWMLLVKISPYGLLDLNFGILGVMFEHAVQVRATTDPDEMPLGCDVDDQSRFYCAGGTRPDMRAAVFRFVETGTIGVDEHTPTGPLHVFPVPASDLVHVDFPVNSDVARMLVADAAGAVVFTLNEPAKGGSVLDVRHWASGPYVVTAVDDDGLIVGRSHFLVR